MVVDANKIKPYANLHGADLRWTNLRETDLRWANLHGADLRWANLREANLRGADLRKANLRGANLHGADLHGANLRGANLHGADLHGANLREADLRGADLRGANLTDCKLPHFQIPQEGSLTVFKKTLNGVIKLEIPTNARRTATLVGRKCRSEFAVVIEGNGQGIHDRTFMYRQGETVRPDKYNDDIRMECTHGIHFFLTREEAEEYY